MGASGMALVAAGREHCQGAWGGEEGRTRGVKLCPPRVLAIPG